MKTRLFLSLLLFAILAACTTQNKELSNSRKKELREKFFNPHFIITDTIIGYQVYSDSLVLKFEPRSHYKDWAVQIILREPSGKNDMDMDDFNPKLVVNNKMVFRFNDFHISPDSVMLYTPELFACPHYEKGLMVYKIQDGFVDNSRMFYKKQGDQNILAPWGPDRGAKHIAFNLKMLKGLSREEYDYCYKILYKESGLSDEDYKELF